MKKYVYCSFIVVGLGSLLLFSNTQKQTNEDFDYSLENPPMCSYGPALKFTELSPAILMGGIGNSYLKVTTDSEMAQQFINQGINHLHSFWDVEAYRAFKAAIQHDPNCAMAYWGLYKSISQTSREMPKEKQKALDKAIELAPLASDREQRFIRATELLQIKGRDAFISEMEALIDAYPDEVEAQLFLATALSTSVRSYTPDGRPRPGKIYGQMILKNIMRDYPDLAAAHHYWIHAVENGPRPELALESARKISAMAPKSGHLTHMPGHIFYRIGAYEEANQNFIHSMKVDSLYMVQQEMNPINNWNYTHNLDYLVASCAEFGQFKDAMKWAQKLREIPIDQGRLMAGGLTYILFGAHTAIPRLLIRFQKWEAAAETMQKQIEEKPELSSLAQDYYKGILAYTKGMDEIQNGEIVLAEEQLKKLESLVELLEGTRPSLGGDWYFGYALKVLKVNAKELKGVVLSASEQHQEAIVLLKEAVHEEKQIGYWEPPHYIRPVSESLAQAYVRSEQLEAAIQAYQIALTQRPNSGHALFGIAQAYEALGKKGQAKKAYTIFLKAWSKADKDLNPILKAKRVLGN